MGAAVILTHFSHLDTMLVSNNLDIISLKKKIQILAISFYGEQV